MMQAQLRSAVLFSALLISSTFFLATSVKAQSRAAQEVIDLNRQALEAYGNLEFEQARTLLERALTTAQRGSVTGNPLARTHLNLGVVAVGGFSDNATGLSHFDQALRADPNVQLDPLVSTPDIQQVFGLARQRLGGSGQQQPPIETPPTETDPPTETPPGPTDSSPSAGLTHEPPREQLTETPVPIFARAEGARRILLFYRGHGMREFRRVEMEVMSRGFGYEIPCRDVFEPQVEYYLAAFDASGSPLGFSGTEAQPISVPIVRQRTMAAPALPGRSPPEQCGDNECPPDMPGCEEGERRRPNGETCSSDSQCQSNSCDDNLCAAPNQEVGPRFFARASVGIGFPFIPGTIEADRQPCPAGVSTTEQPCFEIPDPRWNEGANASATDASGNGIPDDVDTYRSYGYEPGGQFAIDTGFADQTTCSSTNNIYCFYTEVPGFQRSPNMIVRTEIGYYIVDRFALAAEFRFQPDSGRGALSFMTMGLRGEFQLTEPTDMGFHAHAHLGVTFGQIQVFLSRGSRTEYAPYGSTGPVGVNVGGTFGYRFMRNFGVIIQPIFAMQFPSFIFALDATAGLEVSF